MAAGTSEPVGREAEREELGRFLARAATTAAALVLEGEAGIGKTTLWEDAVERARADGFLVLTCRPAEAEAQLSYAALGDLLEPVLDEVLPRLAEPRRHALQVALLLTDPDGAGPDLRAVGVSVLEALRTAAADGPVIVAIDDVQWLDPSTAAVCEFAVRRLADETIGFLVARRTTSTPPPPLGLHTALGPGAVQRVRVARMDAEELRRLLAERAALTLPRPELQRLHDAAGGNPFYALEIARALQRRGGRLGGGGDVPLPDDLRELVRERLDALDARTQEALLAAAALARPTRALVAAAVDAPDAAEVLAGAVDGGIVQIRDDDVRFVHPLVASVHLSGAPPARLRELHRRLADLVDEPERRAAHLALGADRSDEAIAAELEAAAARAAARGAPAAAAELAEQARWLTPAGDRAATARRAITAAEHAFMAGDGSHARLLLDAALEQAPRGPLRAAALIRLALIATYDGPTGEAVELAREALDEAGDDAAILALSHRILATGHWLRLEFDEVERHAAAAAELAARGGNPALVERSAAALAFVRAQRGAPFDAAVFNGPHATSAPADDCPAAMHGLMELHRGNLDVARDLLEACVDAAHERGEEKALGVLSFRLAELECRAGHAELATVLAERALEACAHGPQRLARASALHAVALSAALSGREEVARAAVAEGLELAERVEHSWAVIQLHWTLGLLELSLGRAGDAVASLTAACDAMRAAGVGAPSMPGRADEIEALTGAGDVALAARRLEELDRISGGRFAPGARRSRGLLLAAQGDTEAATADLEAAVAADGAGSAPLDRGRSLLALGAVHRRAKRKRAAREALTAAQEVFDAAGARLWAERCRSELSRIGGRAPSGDALTPTEERVAGLVAQGKTNREVAAALFISIRTVEANLSKVYAKLNVRSRAELAHAFATRTAPAPKANDVVALD